MFSIGQPGSSGKERTLNKWATKREMSWCGIVTKLGTSVIPALGKTIISALRPAQLHNEILSQKNRKRCLLLKRKERRTRKAYDRPSTDPRTSLAVQS